MDLYTAKTPTFATSAASTKTILQIAAPATIRGRLANLTVSFDSATAAQSILVELLVQSTSGTATGSVTPVAADPAAPASLITAAYQHTAEPTAGNIIKGWEVRPDGGILDIPFYDLRMPVIAASGRLGLRYTTASGVNPNVTATLDFWA
jgi:hypothetical protein